MQRAGRRFYAAALGLTVLLLLLGALLGGGAPAAAQTGAGEFVVSDDVWVWDDVRVGDDATISGDLAVTGGAGFAEWVDLSAQTAISVTAGATITPTGTLQRLESGGAVTTSTSRAIADGAKVGRLLVLINMNAANAITVDGTGGNVECKTDKALGTKDTLMLIWNGSDWNCLSLADNS